MTISERTIYLSRFSGPWVDKYSIVMSPKRAAKILPEGSELLSTPKPKKGFLNWISRGRWSSLQYRMRSAPEVRWANSWKGTGTGLVIGMLIDGFLQYFWYDKYQCLSGQERLWNALVAAIGALGIGAVGCTCNRFSFGSPSSRSTIYFGCCGYWHWCKYGRWLYSLGRRS